MLVEMIGPELGLLDQELAKLALAAGSGGTITADDLRQMVGALRAGSKLAHARVMPTPSGLDLGVYQGRMPQTLQNLLLAASVPHT